MHKRVSSNQKRIRGRRMEEITLVTDFFDIGRGQDKNKDLRRTAQRYFDEFKRWARIQNTLVVYTDSASAELTHVLFSLSYHISCTVSYYLMISTC